MTEPLPPLSRKSPAAAVHAAHLAALDDVVTAWSAKLPPTAADAFAEHLHELRRVLDRHAPDESWCLYCANAQAVNTWPCLDYADTVCAILRLASITEHPEPPTTDTTEES